MVRKKGQRDAGSTKRAGVSSQPVMASRMISILSKTAGARDKRKFINGLIL
jgi:hypothetical protein